MSRLRDSAESHFGIDELKQTLVMDSDKETLQKLREIGIHTNKQRLYRWRLHYGVVNRRIGGAMNQSKEIVADYVAGATIRELLVKYRTSTITLQKIIGDKMRSKGRKNA